jgi:phage shock protein PspC (stress-responsive transcriptional regulator)
MTDHEHIDEGDETSEEPRTEEATTREAGTEAASQTTTDKSRTRGGARRLLRSRDDRVIVGVAGGLGRYFRVDPMIFRIGFGLSVLFGGFGLVAYIVAALFIPDDHGAAAIAPGGRLGTVGRIVGIGGLAIVGLAGLTVLSTGAAFVTGLGYGLAVVALIAILGLTLVVTSFRGGARWLIAPALALSIGVGGAAAAQLNFDGGIGARDYRPSSAAAIPTDGYELGVGRLAVDLRDIDWSPKRVVDLKVRVGAGEAVVAVPANVCVVADAHAGAGDLQVAGQHADGTDVDLNTGDGSRATPQLRINADVDLGAIRVLNDDSVSVLDDHQFDRSFQAANPVARAANSEACAS